MASRLACFFSLLFILSLQHASLGQDSGTATSEDHSEALGLVNFYQYLLNTLGDPRTSGRSKEVIVTQSFTKAFRDGNVQIEDDLDQERKVVTNKDVVAYLKDVDFFFKQAKFEFQDIQIEKLQRDNGQTYFKAAFTSVLTGQDIDGAEVSRISDRFIEINFDEEQNDLKIVSVYTTKPNRGKELKLWWESLSLAWKQVFMDKVPLTDSVSFAYLDKVTSIDSVDISGNEFILDLEPLTVVRGLKSVNISNTSISSLEGIRNLIGITHINAEASKVEDIQFLKYLSALETLNLKQTAVMDISVLSGMSKLKELDLSQTAVQNFTPLTGCAGLQRLSLNKCTVYDVSFLSALNGLKHLEMSGSGLLAWPAVDMSSLTALDLSNTMINSVATISSLKSLQELNINSTYVVDIAPLLGVKSLKKVYCDDTPITEEQASAWMNKKRGAIVLTNSAALKDWWKSLSVSWKKAFAARVDLAQNPDLDQLVKLVNLDSLDISGQQLLDGEALARLKRLKYLNISSNLFTNIHFTSEMSDLEVLIANDVPVDDISPLAAGSTLKVFEMQNVVLSDISPLKSHTSLQFVNIDGNPVIESDVFGLLSTATDAIVQYKTEVLSLWWDDLTDDWQKTFLNNIRASGNPTSLQLHEIIELEQVEVNGGAIYELSPLVAMINLKSLKIANVPAGNVEPLASLDMLESLELTRMPLEDLQPLISLKELTSLSISNTPVKTLRPLSELRGLKHLDCSGTNIKNLKGLSELYRLETLNLSNTRVWKLDRLSEISGITEIVCYNTRLRSRTIEEFKMLNPNCQITFY